MLRPLDERTRAIASQWMDWAFSFQNAFRPVFWGLVRTPPEKRDARAIEEARVKSAELLGMLDHALADRHYVAGSFSMGDIPVGATAHRWLALPSLERSALPALRAWHDRLAERVPFREHVMLPLS